MEATRSLFSQHPRRVVATAVALTLVMCSACVYSIGNQIGHPFPGFFYTPDRRVGGFTPPDSSGWQAGLRPGDFIVSVDGQSWREMPRLVRAAAIGDTVDYAVERQRIARELHDGVGPALASLNLRLHTAGKQLQRDQLAVEEIEELADLAQANIKDIRRLIYDLRPAALDELGLVPVLHDYAARWAQEHGVELALFLPQSNERLPATLETALFRIAQEGLANVARHAHAQQVELTLEWDAEAVHLCLADDGQGFDLDEALDRAKQGGHLGLWSMHERVGQLGGQFVVGSALSQGTRLKMTIPRRIVQETSPG